MKISTALILFLILVCSNAVAETLYELTMPASLHISYAPFSGQAAAETFQLNIAPISVDEDLSGESRLLLLRIKPIDTAEFVATGEQSKLPLWLSSSGGAKLEAINLGYEQRLLLDAQLLEPLKLDYTLTVSESHYADPGLYELSLDVELLDAITEELVSVIRNLTVEVVVTPKLQTNIAGASGRYENGVNFAVMNFGTLETGESKRVFIQVRGNAQANIRISSENNGQLKHKERKDAYVDYSVSVDGVFSSLESPLFLERSVAKSLQGSAYPMVVTIGDVDESFSGVYQDIITVDVSPQ